MSDVMDLSHAAGTVAGQAVGRSVLRNEDPRLLRGRGRFVDDIHLPGMLHAAFVRSDLASAVVRSIDTAAARALPGVHGVFTAADIGDLMRPGPLLVPPPPLDGMTFHARTATPLASDRVRHQGEALAVVVADDRYVAEDAAELVAVDLDPLEPVVRLESALAEGAPRVHPDLASNLAAQVRQQKGDFRRAAAEAHLVLERDFDYDRGVAAAIENRGIIASWSERDGELTVWDTTQAPIPVRNGIAAALGLPESRVRVVAPDIGGGFGPKIFFYGDEILIPWIAMQLGRPIKWIEDRYENFFATTQERRQVHTASIAVDADGRILGVRDRFVHDTGAYDPYGLTVPINTQCTLLGPYRVPAYDSEFRVAFTNTPVVTPVRGAGRQQGVFVMERLLDLAARELGIDRVEIRRRNLLEPNEFPHDHEILYQDFAPLTYDSGNYLPALDRAAEHIGYADFPERQRAARAEGRYLGLGIVSYVEGTGIGPYEGARVRVEPGGTVTVAMGVGTQGQGHFTVFAQVVAEQLGVPVERVRVVTGDTREFHWGTGTFASRGAVVAGSATHTAATAVREKVLRLASRELEIAPEDLELVDGRVRVAGVPEKALDLGELAVRANPLRGAVEPGTEPGLEATSYFGPSSGSTASGVHALVVEVDPETCGVEIIDYVVVHDCGRVINPMIVEGQVHGGVAMGIGNAFYEELRFDAFGSLTNASFMDYLIPTATEVPAIRTDHIETPSPLNPLGAKGVGEAGAIPVAAAFAQAVEDAWPETGLELRVVPLSPRRLWETTRDHGEGLEGAEPSGGGEPSSGGNAAGDAT